MNNKKILSSVILCSLIFSLLPLSPQQITHANETNLNNIPAFPEDIAREETNWVELNWEAGTILPEDRMEYEKKYEQLIEDGKFSEAQSLEMKKTPMYDEESLHFYGVPNPVQSVVSEHFETLQNNTVQSANHTELLKQKIQAVMNNGMVQSVDSSQTINSGLGGTVIYKTQSEVINEEELPEVSIQEFNIQKGKLEKLQDNETVSETSFEIIEEEKVSGNTLQSTKPKLMEYYAGIKQNSTDYALYSLNQKQNPDGSIGINQKSRNTYAFIKMLENVYRTNTFEYEKAQSYFVNLKPKNNLERIYKISVLNTQKLDYTEEKSILDAQISADGGIGYDIGYQSDLFTTIEAGILYGSIGTNGDVENYKKTMNYIVPKIAADGKLKYHPKFNGSSQYLSYKLWQLLNLGDFTGKSEILTKVENNLAQPYTQENILDTAVSGRYLEMKKDFEISSFLKTSLWYEQGFDGLFGDILTSIYVTEFIAEANIKVLDIINIGELKNRSLATFQVNFTNTGYKKAHKIKFDRYMNYKQREVDFVTPIIELPPHKNIELIVPIEVTTTYKGNTKVDFIINSENDFLKEDNHISKDFTFLPDQNKTAKMPSYFIAHSHQIENSLGFNVRMDTDYQDPDLLRRVLLYRKEGELNWYKYILPSSWNGAFISGFKDGDKVEVNVGVISKSQPDKIISFAQPSIFTITRKDNEIMYPVSGKVFKNGKNLASAELYSYGGTYISEYDGSFMKTIKEGKNIVKIDDSRYESYYKVLTLGNNAVTDNITLNTNLIKDTEKPIIHNLRFKGDWEVKNNRERNIIIEAKDNIAIKNVELYYLDPKVDSRIFMKDIDMKYSSAEYVWNITNEYLGQGYKLKAVAADYSGNISESLEYGPFEIVDGTGPDGTITLSKTQVSLGQSFPFLVNIKDLSTFKSIEDVNLIFPNGIKNIERELSDRTNPQLVYSVPYRSDYLGEDLYIELKICAVNGSCTKITSPKFSIIDVPFSLEKPWIDKGNIGFSLSNGDYNRTLYNVQFHDNGIIDLVYKDFYKYTGRTYQLIYRKYENGRWQSPLILKTLPNSRSGDYYKQLSGINTYRKGNKTLVGYYSLGFGPNTDFNKQLDLTELSTILIENNQKKWEKQITHNDTLSHDINFNIDNQNTIHVTYRDGYSVSKKEGIKNLKYINIEGGNISAIQELTNSGYGYDAKIFQINNKLYSGYEGEQGKYYIREYNFLIKKWGNKMFAFMDQDMRDYYLFSNEEKDTFDIFFRKGQGKGLIGTSYNISHKKFKIVDGNIIVESETNITAATNDYQIQHINISKTNDGTSHIIYTKRFWEQNKEHNHFGYIKFKNSVLDSHLLVPPTTKMDTNVYLSQDAGILYAFYSAEISQMRTTKFLKANLVGVGNGSGKSGQFQFPEVDIQLEISISKFGFTFIIEGYKLNLWIDLF